MKENDSERKPLFLQHKGDHSNNKDQITDGSKSTGRKVGFAVFADLMRRGAYKKAGHEIGNIQTR